MVTYNSEIAGETMVEDPLTGDTITAEEMDYRTQLREAAASRELIAQPVDETGEAWQFQEPYGAVEQRNDGFYFTGQDGITSGPYAEDAAYGLSQYGSIEAWNANEAAGFLDELPGEGEAQAFSRRQGNEQTYNDYLLRLSTDRLRDDISLEKDWLPYRTTTLGGMRGPVGVDQATSVRDELPSPVVSPAFLAQQASEQFEQIGLPGELWQIASKLERGGEEGGYYADPNIVTTGTYRLNEPRGLYVVGHETLHAFENNLTEDELSELNKLIAENPPPNGLPFRHHPPGQPDPNAPTGITDYFDYIYGGYAPEEPGTGGPGEFDSGKRIVGQVSPQVPAAIMDFLRKKAPIVAARMRVQPSPFADPYVTDTLRETPDINTDIPLTPEQQRQMSELSDQLSMQETGETDPVINRRLHMMVGALDLGDPDLTREAQQAMYRWYKDGMAAINAGQLLDQGNDRDAAFKRAWELTREELFGNAATPGWQTWLDNVALKATDPITTAGKAVVGEEAWENLPEGVQTAASWAPILMAPQKGILKDLAFGGMGLKGGTAAIVGAAATSELAPDTGFVGELAAGIAAPTIAGRLAAATRALKTGVVEEADRAITPMVAKELNDIQIGVRDAKPDELVTLYYATNPEDALRLERDGLNKGGVLTTDPEVAVLQAYDRADFVDEASVVAFQVPRRMVNEKDGFFVARTNLPTTVSEASSGFIEDAYGAVRRFLADERGGITLRTTNPTGPLNPSIIHPMDDSVDGLVLSEKKAAGSSSFVGIHYGKEETAELRGEMYGQGISGAERARVTAPGSDPRLSRRVYFYIQKPDGTMPRPEAGVGQNVYTQKFDNILAPGPDMSRLNASVGGDPNRFEAAVIDAGYDGYAIPNMGMMVILDKNVPVRHAGIRSALEAGAKPKPLTDVPSVDDRYGGRWGVEEDRIKRMGDDDLRAEYEEARKGVSNAQNALDAFQETGAQPGAHIVLSEDNIRGRLLQTLDQVARLGEELYRRTGGVEGMPARIGRAIDQLLVEEEGSLKLPFMQRTPQGTNQVVHNRRVPATARLLGIKPIIPRLTKPDRVFNLVKNTLETDVFGPPADPLGTAVVREGARVQPILEAQANAATAQIAYLVKANFDLDAKGGIKSLPAPRVNGKEMARPTVQDVAAALPQYRPLLTDAQYNALVRMRDIIKPYTEALVEQGIELKTRADVLAGEGFYLPRGRAAEDGIDYDAWGIRPPPSRRVQKNFQQQARFDTMAQGVDNNFEYLPIDVAMHTYFRDAGQQVLDSHIAHVLRNATDDAGILLGETPAARLLKNNPKLAARMEMLRRQAGSLLKSVENLDDRIHSIWQTFVASPAPDLDALRDAVNKLTTSNGSIRVRITDAERELNFKIIRKQVREEVFRNRGMYKGYTGEQARRLALRDAIDKARVRRGRFKGLTYEQGKAQLDYLKSQIAGIMPDWEQAKKDALKTPSGSMTVDSTTSYGRLLQGVAFDEELSSVLNDHLRSLGPPRGMMGGVIRTYWAATNLLRGMRSTADASFMGNQGLLGLFTDPAAYGHAMGVVTRSMNDVHALGKFLEGFDAAAAGANMPSASEWISGGAHLGGAESEFMIGGRFSRMGNLPIIKQANRAFGYFGDALRLGGMQGDYADRLVNINPRTGTVAPVAKTARDKAVHEIATAWNGMTGWSPGRLGGDIGSFLTFAPRFYMAQVETLVRAVAGNGLTRDVARKSLIRTIGAASLLTAAANYALGNEVGDKDFNWWSPTVNGRLNRNFMRIRAGGVDISLFGIYDSLVYGVVGAIDGDPAFLARSKANPIVGTAIDIVTGKNILGEAVTPESVLRSMLPFSIQHVGQEPPLKTATGILGVKASEESVSEKMGELRTKTINDLINDGTIPPDMRDFFSKTDYFDLSSSMKKLVDRAIQERSPDQYDNWVQYQRDSGNVYRGIADRADTARSEYSAVYDDILNMLLNGTPPKEVWEAYDDARNKLAGRLEEIYEGTSPDTKKYRASVDSLRPNDMRRLEDAWNAIVTDNRKGASDKTPVFDWDKIEQQRIEFLEGLNQADPATAARFVYSLQLKDKFDLEDAHPLIQLQKLTNEALQPYYDLLDKGASAQEKDIWLNTHPDADFGRWMIATWDDPTVNSVAAAAEALSVPGRPVKLQGATTVVTEQNLPILQQYDKQITQLLTLPGTAKTATGDTYYPKALLRERDPLYDALYYWLGFDSSPDGTAVVYHLNAVLEYLKVWGPRTDGVRPRQAK